MQDKRKYPRISAIHLISVMEVSPSDMVQEHGHLGATVNLSRSGVLFESKVPIPLLSELRLSMTLKDNLLELEGRVVRLEEMAPARIAIAIHFTKISPEDQEWLDQYLGEKQSPDNEQGEQI